ncbi:trypsin-like [Hetaerina americana]|uniref:trypsin-like n=1 Tax=Hetaerina americana TaxID=62018 RepID=UPI003A7F2734
MDFLGGRTELWSAEYLYVIDETGQPLFAKFARDTNPQPYIEGGEIVEGREFPWMASLSLAGYHYCTFNIINSEWILGVASCMLYDWNYYSVMVGSNSLDAVGTIHNVIKVVKHEAYNESNSWINDIAVLQVSPPIEMGNGVSPVVLADQGQAAPPVGTTATVAGWGALQFPGPAANDLHKLEVVVVDHRKCEEIYAPIPKKVIYSSQICASGKLPGQSPTNGDSGAPLIVGEKVVGMVSWARKIGNPEYPAVYTDLNGYIDWINEHIKN